MSIIENGERVGWTLKGINSVEGTLAHVSLESEIRMGRYGIDLELFASIVDAELDQNQPADAYVIDEIGLISAMYPPFDPLLNACLDSETPVIAIVREKSTEILASIEARSDMEVLRVESTKSGLASVLIDDWISSVSSCTAHGRCLQS
jgi:nucleoside-triphosphatase THEP1